MNSVKSGFYFWARPDYTLVLGIGGRQLIDKGW